MKSLVKAALVVLPALVWAGHSSAGVYHPSGPATPGSYGTSTHTTPKWQQLGTSPWLADGVSWSVDGGSTWGNADLFVGQTVKFKFDMKKNKVGTHYADHLAAWLDWGQDGTFDSSDQIAYDEHILSTEKGVVNTAVERSLGTNRNPDTPNITFFSEDFFLTAAHAGETWLRALVTCSESIVKTYNRSLPADERLPNNQLWNAQWNRDYKDNYEDRLFATGLYYQGETEHYRIVVNNVSEPATFLLMGLGLVGIAAARKRVK